MGKNLLNYLIKLINYFMLYQRIYMNFYFYRYFFSLLFFDYLNYSVFYHQFYVRINSIIIITVIIIILFFLLHNNIY